MCEVNITSKKKFRYFIIGLVFGFIAGILSISIEQIEPVIKNIQDFVGHII